MSVNDPEMLKWLYSKLDSVPNPKHPIVAECEKLGLRVVTTRSGLLGKFLIGLENEYFGCVEWCEARTKEDAEQVVKKVYLSGLFES